MNKDTLRMQMLAGIITESQYKHFTLILEDNTIEEGLKDWIIKGLIALTTLGGVGKVYQMDQQQQLDKKNKIEYYDNVLSKEVNKMSENDLFDLGAAISEKTGALKSNHDWSKDPEGSFKRFVTGYAEDYMRAHPDEFAIGVNGGIYWLKAPSSN
jgi:hypothetical protein